MQRQKYFFPSKNFMNVSYRVKSWDTVVRNGWHIKFSILDDCKNILVLFVSKSNGQSLIKSFSNENDACNFINYVINLDSNCLIYDGKDD